VVGDGAGGGQRLVEERGPTLAAGDVRQEGDQRRGAVVGVEDVQRQRHRAVQAGALQERGQGGQQPRLPVLGHDRRDVLQNLVQRGLARVAGRQVRQERDQGADPLQRVGQRAGVGYGLGQELRLVGQQGSQRRQRAQPRPVTWQ